MTTDEALIELNAKLAGTLAEAREHIAALRDVVSDEDLRRAALYYAIVSHGEAPGKESDRCFIARAKVFEDYLRDGE